MQFSFYFIPSETGFGFGTDPVHDTIRLNQLTQRQQTFYLHCNHSCSNSFDKHAKHSLLVHKSIHLINVRVYFGDDKFYKSKMNFAIHQY